MFPCSITALITPFTETQDLDQKAFRSLVQRQIEAGTEALVIFGTTGESPTLTEEEKLLLLEMALEEAQGVIPIIVGSGDNNTRSTFDFTAKCKERGAHGALIISPYYNRPTERGVLLHMQEVSKVGLPLIFYYHPGRCGSKLSPDCIRQITSLDEVVGLKDCSSDPQIIAASQKRVFCGNDGDFLKVAEMGVEGSISVIANLIPEKWKQIVCRQDKALFDELGGLLSALELEVNPQPIKYLCFLAGLCKNELRLPMTPVSEESQKKLLIASLMQEDTAVR